MANNAVLRVNLDADAIVDTDKDKIRFENVISSTGDPAADPPVPEKAWIYVDKGEDPNALWAWDPTAEEWNAAGAASGGAAPQGAVATASIHSTLVAANDAGVLAAINAYGAFLPPDSYSILVLRRAAADGPIVSAKVWQRNSTVYTDDTEDYFDPSIEYCTLGNVDRYLLTDLSATDFSPLVWASYIREVDGDPIVMDDPIVVLDFTGSDNLDGEFLTSGPVDEALEALADRVRLGPYGTTNTRVVPMLHLTPDPDFPIDGSATHCGGSVLLPDEPLLIASDIEGNGGVWVVGDPVSDPITRKTNGQAGWRQEDIGPRDIWAVSSIGSPFLNTLWKSGGTVQELGMENITSANPVTRNYSVGLVGTLDSGVITVALLDGTTEDVAVSALPDLTTVFLSDTLRLLTIDDGAIAGNENYSLIDGDYVARGVTGHTGGRGVVAQVIAGAVTVVDAAASSPGDGRLTGVPTVTAGTGAGTGATIDVFNPHDDYGCLTINTGTTCAANGIVATIAPSDPSLVDDSIGAFIFLNPCNSPTALFGTGSAAAELSGTQQVYAECDDNGTWVIRAGSVALADTESYTFVYRLAPVFIP